MSVPVIATAASPVSVGDPTRSSHYNDLYEDVRRALTQYDFGVVGSIPGSPDTGQAYLDTTNDLLLLSLDGSTFQGIASTEVIVDAAGLSIT